MKTINGHKLKQMIISGANNLFNGYPEVDALNVFPVPDGDTGTNMNLAMTSGAKEVMNIDDISIYDVAKAFSKGLLMGARGNSGVILSQIFRGFAMGLEGKSEVNCYELSDAFISAKDIAYKAVMKPVEGTILTVIRESSIALKQKLDTDEKAISIEDAIDYLLKEAKESLERTPDLLPVLKEVGVVDSGGAGLVKVLEGFSSALHNNLIERNKPLLGNETILTSPQAKIENGEFGYCTEFILELDSTKDGKKLFNKSRFTSVLENKGDSIVIVEDEHLVKVHIHTLKPGIVFNYAQQFGEFVTLKVENMQLQHSNILEKDDHTTLLNLEKKEYGLISVAAGEGLKNMFRELRVDHIVDGGQTMNPSTEDFVEAIKKVNSKNVFIMPNNTNILLAAKQACEVVEGINCKVIETKTIPEGLLACMTFNPNIDDNNNYKQMSSSIRDVKSGQVTFSIKDTKINGMEIKENHFISLMGKNIISTHGNKIEVTKKLLDELIDEDSEIITIISGQEASEEETTEIVDYINKNYSLDVEVKEGNQPVYCYIVGVE